MVNTVRTDNEMLSLLADNVTRDISEQDIRDMFVTLRAGKTWVNTSWNINDIVQAMQEGGHVHFAAGTYDFTNVSGSAIPFNSPLMITGDGRLRTIFTGGGVSNTVASQKFELHKDFVCRDIGFEATRAFWGIGADLVAEIDFIEIADCLFDTAGGIIFYDIDTGTPDAAAALGTVRILNNRTTDCHSGVWMRLGAGAGTTSIPIRRFIASKNDMTGLNRGGICCFYDSPPTNGVYELGGVGIAIQNTIIGQNPDSGTATGFGCNLGACETDIRIGNYFQDIVKGTRVNVEPHYSKSKYILWANNVVRGGDQDQGAFAVKSDDDAQEGHALLIGNHVISDDVPAGGASTGAWIQGQNVVLIGNKFHGNWDGGSVIRIHGGGAGGTAMNEITIKDNEISIYNPTGITPATGVQRAIQFQSTGDANRPNIIGNRIFVNGKVQNNFSGIYMESGTTVDRDIVDPLVADNRIYWGPSASMAGGTARGINLARSHVNSNISNPYVLRNHIDGFNTGLLITETGGALDGSVYILDNTIQDVTTPYTSPTTTVANATVITP